MLKMILFMTTVLLSAPTWASECWSFKSFDDDDRIFNEITEVQFDIDPQTSEFPERLARLRIYETKKGKKNPVLSEGTVKCEKEADSAIWHCVAVERGLFEYIRQGDEVRLVIGKYLNTMQQSGKDELGFEFEVKPGDPPIEMVTTQKCSGKKN